MRTRTLFAPRRTAHAFFEGAAPASGAGDPPPATPPAAAASSGSQTAGDPPPTDPRERELAEARREAAQFRTELRKLQDQAKAADEAKLSEQEKLTRRVAELEQQLTAREAAARSTRLSAAAQTAAAKLGFADPEDAERFLDAAAVEWSTDDGDGRPKNVQQLLQKVLEAKPYLRASGPQAPNLGQGSRGQASLTLEQVRRLAAERPDEFNRRFEAGEFREAMAATAGRG
jgi:hypothetical protein